MGLYEFVKQKVEKESLYDYELAGILNVNRAFIGKLRKNFAIEKPAKFPRLFERTYGADAVERLKKIIEIPATPWSTWENILGFPENMPGRCMKKYMDTPILKPFKTSYN